MALSSIRFVVALLLFLMVSCQQNDKKAKPVVPQQDSIALEQQKKEQERSDKRTAMLEREKYDSLQLDLFLKKALQLADKNKNRNQYKESYVETMPDSSFQVTVTVGSDFYFTKQHPHLVIRLESPNTNCIAIYSKTGQQFKKVASHEEWNMTYVSDTIRDINGDGLKDFVVNTYGANGCCLKAFNMVYLLRSDKKGFSEGFEFINPTFSPNEKTIRGICYGHPGETEMYKYQWNGEKVDTIEYVSYQKNAKGEKTGKVILSKDRYGEKPGYKVLNAVPKEYTKIKEYDWFTGNP